MQVKVFNTIELHILLCPTLVHLTHITQLIGIRCMNNKIGCLAHITQLIGIRMHE